MTKDKKQALIARSQARLKAAILPTQGSGSAHRDSPPPIVIKPPDWFVWRNIPRVEPWEACALALNYEPDSVEHGFPSEEEADKHAMLVKMLNANHDQRQHFSQNFAMGVRLNEFAAWCIHIGFDIRPELAELAKGVPQVALTATNEADTQKQVAPAAKVKAVADTTPAPIMDAAQEKGIHRGLDGSPPLKKGKNARDKVDAWVKWQARTMVKAGDNASDLVDRIYTLADKWGYQSDRTKDGETISIATITKMLPEKITGGRGKNRGKSKK